MCQQNLSVKPKSPGTFQRLWKTLSPRPRVPKKTEQPVHCRECGEIETLSPLHVPKKTKQPVDSRECGEIETLSPRHVPKKTEQPVHCSEIEKVFRYIDTDGDGRISPSELQHCVQAVGVHRLSAEEAAAAVECSDSDGDGLLTLADFERLVCGAGVPEAERAAELREAFAMYGDDRDDSDSGCITPRSLKRMLGRLGENKSIRECEAIIRVYDLNGDGVLSFDEFAAMMS